MSLLPFSFCVRFSLLLRLFLSLNLHFQIPSPLSCCCFHHILSLSVLASVFHITSPPSKPAHHTNTMHSPSRLVRKSPPLIRHIILTPHKGSHHRPFSLRSQPSISSLSLSSSLRGAKEEGCGGAEASVPLRSWLSSGLLVMGSALGLCYWAPSPAHADQGVATEFRDAPPQKKPTFLFKGFNFIQNDAYI